VIGIVKHWFCMKCMAKKVRENKIRPLTQVFGPNESPFKHCRDGYRCGLCGYGNGSHDALFGHPEMERFVKS